MENILDKKSISHSILSACEVLRGLVDFSSYKEYVLTMLFFKFLSDEWRDLSDNDKSWNTGREILFKDFREHKKLILPPSANFWSLYKTRHQPGNGARIDHSLDIIQNANHDILQDLFNGVRFDSSILGTEAQKDRILRHLFEAFATDALDMRPKIIKNRSVIGDAYDALIGEFATVEGRKGGEFYTPQCITQLLARLLNPNKSESICDPACGAASLLLGCARGDQSSTSGPHGKLFGQEANRTAWALAKMNMLMHDELDHRIDHGNTLQHPTLIDASGKLMCFDVIVSNPPFSSAWACETAENDPFDRFSRGIPPKAKSDFAFILHMLATLKPKTGRLGVVVPNGVLFRGAIEGDIRKQLLEENLLDTVVGLPAKLFINSSIPTTILIFRMGRVERQVLFIDASREFDSEKTQNKLSEAHISRIVDVYRARENMDNFSRCVSLDEIRSNNYNLSIARYVEPCMDDEEAIFNLPAIRVERAQIASQLQSLETEIASYIEKIEGNSLNS